MFNSSVLDIAIGLVLVYLLISVVLTSVSEAIEGILKTRAKDLERALGEVFQGDPTMLRDFYNHPLISGLYLGGYRGTPATDATPASAEEAPAPAAQAAVPDAAGGGHGNLPSYIPREAFSAAVMDLLKDPRGARLKQAVEALAVRHGVDPAATRGALENWYDGAMDRASGWFKRRTQVRLFILGLAIAVIGNVNSVTIAQYLASNQEAREGLVQMAPQSAASMPNASGASTAGGATNQVATNGTAANAATADVNSAGSAAVSGNASGNSAAISHTAQQAGAAASTTDSAQRDAWLRDQTGKLRALGLPIGWSDPVVALMASGFPSTAPASATESERWAVDARWSLALVILIAGYLATAFAVMLGAPFWFDLLGKLMVVRSTVKPKQKSPDDPPVDGPAPAPAAVPAAGPVAAAGGAPAGPARPPARRGRQP